MLPCVVFFLRRSAPKPFLNAQAFFRLQRFMTDDSEHHGPSCWKDFFSWPQRTVDRLSCLTSLNCHPQLVFTSTFSGLGTADVACTMAHRAVCGTFRNSCVIHYAACDADQHCQTLLKNMECVHVFRDVKECFDKTVMSILEKHVEDNYLAIQQVEDKFERKAEIKKRGKEVCSFACDLLSHHAPQPSAYCVKCQKDCPRFPLSPVLHGNAIWCEGPSGSPCYPWTPAAYGNQLQWLHPAVTPVFFAWIFSLLNSEPSPDVILHENVPGFDFEMMQDIVGHKYRLQSVVISPDACGLPVSRPRRLTVSRRDLCIVLVSSSSVFPLPNIAHDILFEFGPVFFFLDSPYQHDELTQRVISHYARTLRRR